MATLPTATAVSQKTSARLLEQLATTRIKSIDLNASEDVLIIATEHQ